MLVLAGGALYRLNLDMYVIVDCDACRYSTKTRYLGDMV